MQFQINFKTKEIRITLDFTTAELLSLGISNALKSVAIRRPALLKLKSFLSFLDESISTIKRTPAP